MWHINPTHQGCLLEPAQHAPHCQLRPARFEPCLSSRRPRGELRGDSVPRSRDGSPQLRRRPRQLGRSVLALLVALAVLAASLPRDPVRGAAAAGPCDPPVTQPIVCENSKTGNPASEWDLGLIDSSQIRGFSTDISVTPGGTIRFKVTTGATAYRIDVYRLGYYAGL